MLRYKWDNLPQPDIYNKYFVLKIVFIISWLKCIALCSLVENDNINTLEDKFVLI